MFIKGGITMNEFELLNNEISLAEKEKNTPQNNE